MLVTGAAGGIGSEVCRRVRASGATITALDLPERRDSALWEELDATFVGADLAAGLDAAEAGLADVDEVHGIVNVAAIEPPEAFPRYSDRAWDATFAVNVRAAMHVIQTLHPRFAPGTSIVNFLSLEALTVVNTTSKTTAMYAASKGALATFTRTLAVDLGREGHRVNAVAPGLIATPMTEKMASTSRSWIVEQTPLGRVGEPRDIAKVVVFLLSDAAGFVVGQTIPIDGGLGATIG